jgi:hypothetical protein
VAASRLELCGRECGFRDGRQRRAAPQVFHSPPAAQRGIQHSTAEHSTRRRRRRRLMFAKHAGTWIVAAVMRTPCINRSAARCDHHYSRVAGLDADLPEARRVARHIRGRRSGVDEHEGVRAITQLAGPNVRGVSVHTRLREAAGRGSGGGGAVLDGRRRVLQLRRGGVVAAMVGTTSRSDRQRDTNSRIAQRRKSGGSQTGCYCCRGSYNCCCGYCN